MTTNESEQESLNNEGISQKICGIILEPQKGKENMPAVYIAPTSNAVTQDTPISSTQVTLLIIIL